MKLAIYDFDGTYVSKQTLPLLYKLWKEKHLNDKAYKKIWRGFLWRYMLYKLKIFGWDKRRINPYTMRKTADLFASIPKDQLDIFIKEYYIFLQDFVNKKLKKQLNEDIEKGYHPVLLSGNLDIILEPFKNDGFKTIIGTKSVKNNQIITSDKVKILIEDKKLKALKKAFPDADYKQSKAYADNGYDLPVLKSVGKAIAVNPDKELRAHALANTWKIIE